MIHLSEATPAQVSLVRELFLEYARSLHFDLGFQGFEAELDALPGSYSAPRGCLVLAWSGESAVGCVAVRPLRDDIAEMKRLFVKPAHQGRGVGRLLALAAVTHARAAGYRKIRLDTVPGMNAAQRMYKSLGFYEIAPYRENPVRGTVYFEKAL